MITKTELDKLVEKYENKTFIESDPIQIPHRYKDKEDIEIVAFISALFAYGSRKVFIPKLDELFSKMGEKPLEYIKNGEFSNLINFNYRFAKENDVIEILKILSKLYNSNETIQTLFRYGYEQKSDIKGMLQVVTDYFYLNSTDNVGEGFYFMLANPKNNGAMKRLNMFLRWLVRKPPVDFGLWDFIPTSELLIPLDTHVAKISREMNLLTRKSNDFKAVLELTDKLKQFDANDPTKYDFAIYAKGINE